MTRERLARGTTAERDKGNRDKGGQSVRPASVAPFRVPTAGMPSEMLSLQRSAGNRVVVAQLGRIQAKLMVGSAYDPAERQADDVAHEVMRQLRGGAGQVASVEHEEPGLQRAILRRSTAAAPIGLDGGEVSPEIHNSIQSERGRGQALPDTVRQPFERALGTDLSDVRVHHGEKSSELNRAVSARAFTIGSDIFLGAGQYRPSSHEGQELLAHEVTHTIQQRH